jgi:hypothetical protein
MRYGDLNRPLPELAVVPDRPNRIEPRLKKRRNDHFGLLTKPRAQMRKVPRSRRSRPKI